MDKPTFRLITKTVVGLPWDGEVEFNYFRAIVIFGDEEIDPNTAWSKSEDEAVRASLDWLSTEWWKDWRNNVERRYTGFPFPVQGKYSAPNYAGYYVVREDRSQVAHK